MKVEAKVGKLKELVDIFVEDVECIKKATALNEVSALERKCVQEMWAIQSVAGAVGNDLKLAVYTARKNIKNGTVIKEEPVAEPVEKPVEEVVETPVEEPKPEKKPRRKILRRKTKKASK